MGKQGATVGESGRQCWCGEQHRRRRVRRTYLEREGKPGRSCGQGGGDAHTAGWKQGKNLEVEKKEEEQRHGCVAGLHAARRMAALWAARGQFLPCKEPQGWFGWTLLLAEICPGSTAAPKQPCGRCCSTPPHLFPSAAWGCLLSS